MSITACALKKDHPLTHTLPSVSSYWRSVGMMAERGKKKKKTSFANNGIHHQNDQKETDTQTKGGEKETILPFYCQRDKTSINITSEWLYRGRKASIAMLSWRKQVGASVILFETNMAQISKSKL